MRNKAIYAIFAVLLLAMVLIIPANAWVYPDGSEDNLYELFGPRVDKIFVDMYGTEDLMWTALKDGKIDVTDWPLSKTWYAEFIKPEYAGKVKVCYAGGEAGYYIVEFNHNNDTLLAPGVPNPIITSSMAQDPMAGNETDDGGRSGLSLRRAICLLFNRTRFVDEYLGAMGALIYTPVPSYMGGYIHPEIRPGGTLETYAYLYNKTKAKEILDASLYKMGTDGWRYFDINDNNVKEPGEDLTLIFNYRSDHAGRRKIGEMLTEELQSEGIKIHVNACPLSAMDNYIKSMLENNFHMSTFGWINMGPDPDYLHDLYTEAGCWYDPSSSCNNEGYLRDPILNEYGKRIKYANTFDEAKQYTLLFQERFAFLAAQLPTYCNVAYKAHSVKYVGDGATVGPEDKYEGKNWTSIINQVGFGTNSWWTFLNAHPEPDEYGDGSYMTIRYGWKTKGYPQHLNPLYAEWYWDHEVLNKIYDSLGFRDPYDLSTWKPWLVKRWQEGTWVNPQTGETLTKVTLTLRTDIKWSDGVPFSMADVIFTLVESTPMLLAKGFAPPWYYANVESIMSWTVIDACNLELLLSAKSVFAVGWILGGEYIIPKHIWKPIIESGNPAVFKPDPNVVGTGPFKFVSHAPDVSVVLEKNPLFFKRYPKDVNVHTDVWLQKLNLADPAVKHMPVTLVVKDENLIMEHYVFRGTTPLGGNPMGPPPEVWEGEWPMGLAGPPPCTFTVADYIDQDPPTGLSPCDMVALNDGSGRLVWMHVQEVWENPAGVWHYRVGPVLIASKYVRVYEDVDGANTKVYDEGPIIEYEKPGIPITENITLDLKICHHRIEVAKLITNQWYLLKNNTVAQNPWYGQWINKTYDFWITILEDTAGAYWDTWHTEPEIPIPDCFCEITDVATAAYAFGSYPGHPRWSSISDIIKDYQVDIGDIASIAYMFGWP
jgi:ABC-type transport system substrate-binding protein